MKVVSTFILAILLWSCSENGNSSTHNVVEWRAPDSLHVDSFVQTTGNLSAKLLYSQMSNDSALIESKGLFTISNANNLHRFTKLTNHNGKPILSFGNMHLEIGENSIYELKVDSISGEEITSIEFGNMELGRMDPDIDTFNLDTIYDWSQSFSNGTLSVESKSCCCMHFGDHNVNFENEHGTFHLVKSLNTFILFEDPRNSDIIVVQHAYCGLRIDVLRIKTPATSENL
ncbi:MAG: hypothetical protein HWE14_03090 [Flavobacteriia bacterium]|nr:hypothetical protein [Flavobacteriia bacterium]